MPSVGGSIMTTPMPRGSAARLEVCLQEPEPLVHPAGDVGEHVRGDLVPQFVRLVDGGPGELAVRSQGGGKGVDVLVAFGDVRRVLGELAGLHRLSRAAL